MSINISRLPDIETLKKRFEEDPREFRKWASKVEFFIGSHDAIEFLKKTRKKIKS